MTTTGKTGFAVGPTLDLLLIPIHQRADQGQDFLVRLARKDILVSHLLCPTRTHQPEDNFRGI